MNQFRNMVVVLLMLCAIKASAQNGNTVSPDTVIDFSVSPHRGIKGDGSVVYILEKDNQTISAYRRNDMLWKVHVINLCGEPTAGESVVRYLSLEADLLKVIFGEHDKATINIYSGEINCEGADKRVR